VRRAISIVTAVLVLGGVARAAEDSRETLGTSRGAFMLRGMGARPVGMGEAFTAVADDASAAAWNPGGLGRLTQVSAVATYDAAGQGMAMSQVAAAAPLPYVGGVLGLSIVHMDYGTYEKRDALGNFLGNASPEDMGVVASWAFRNPGVFPGWTGVSAEVVREASGIILPGAALGVMLPFSSNFCFGAAVQHISPARNGFSLPLLARGGLAITPAESLNLSVDVGYAPIMKETIIGTGLEVTVMQILALRCGYRMLGNDQRLGGMQGLTAGAGIRVASFGIDYAYQPFGDLATSHRVSLVYGGRKRDKSAFEEAIEPEIDVIEADYQESVELYRAGRLDAAARKARQVIDADGLNWKGWQMLGTVSYAKGDLPAAREYFEKALELNPANDDLRAFLAKMEEPGPKAAVSRPAGNDSSAGSTGGAAYIAAVSLYSSSHYQEAKVKAREAVTADPSDWKAWQMIGNCSYALGDKPGAIEAYRRSLAINPSNQALEAWVKSLQ